MSASLPGRFISLFAVLAFTSAQAQINPICPSITFRNNSNGSATACPGVNGNPVAANVSGTSYATVPTTSKTGNIRFALPLTSSTPYIISRVYQGSALLSSKVGPPGPMDVSNRDVNYCFYDNGAGSGNLPTSGTVTFLFQNPMNTNESCLCAYDFSNNNIATAPLFTLPVVFTYFEAKAVENRTGLEWQTSSEENAAFFLVEQSNNGSNWTAIGQVPAKGTSSVVNTYRFWDPATRNGTSYYRLKQVDTDGRFVYTGIRKVERSVTQPPISIQQGTAGTLVLQHAGQPVMVGITAMDGRLLWKGWISQDITRIDVSRWGKGLYLCRWEQATEKFIIR